MAESAPTAPSDLGLFIGRWFQGLACLFLSFNVLAPLPLPLAFKLWRTALVAVPLLLLLSPRTRAEFAPPGV